MAATTTTTRIMALEGQLAQVTELLSQLVAANAAKPVVQAPAVTTRRDDWIPHYDACAFSRPVVAIFDDDNAAFDFRAAMAAQVSHPVAVRPCRVGPKGQEFRGYAVY